MGSGDFFQPMSESETNYLHLKTKLVQLSISATEKLLWCSGWPTHLVKQGSWVKSWASRLSDGNFSKGAHLPMIV